MKSEGERQIEGSLISDKKEHIGMEQMHKGNKNRALVFSRKFSMFGGVGNRMRNTGTMADRSGHSGVVLEGFLHEILLLGPEQ